MRVRLSPAVHGHIADSVRAGPAARTTPCSPVALVIRGIVGGSPSPRNDHRWHSSRSAHSPQNPSASAASSRGTGTRGRPSNAAAAPRSAVMITASPAVTCRSHPRRSARPAGPRGASVSRRAAVPARTFDGPAADLRWTRQVLAPMLAGGQISRPPAHYGQRLAIPRTRPRDWGSRAAAALPGAKSRDHSAGWQRRWGFMSAGGIDPIPPHCSMCYSAGVDLQQTDRPYAL
jgi:hypothetical protein